jgi:hypothetical protein
MHNDEFTGWAHIELSPNDYVIVAGVHTGLLSAEDFIL